MESIAKSLVLALLALALAGMVSVVQASEARAQDMSAQLDEYNAVCFDEAGEWLATDGCIRSAARMGIEVANIIESDAKGCVLNDMFEDYSCKGPSAPS